MAVTSSASALERLQNYKEPTIKRVTKERQVRIDAVTVKSEKATEQYSALGTLSGLVRNLTSATATLQSPYNNPFDKKIANVTTTDTGLPGKYISVEVSKNAPKMTLDVRVEQIGKASTLLIGRAIDYDPMQDTSANNNGGGPVNLDGMFDFDVDGTVVNVPVVPADSGKDIIRKINKAFNDSAVKATATLVKLPGGNAQIQIFHQELGDKQITSQFTDSDHMVGVVLQYSADSNTLNTTGQNAVIHVNNVRLEQNSNLFDGATVGIEGITIKALAANTVGGSSQQVDVVSNASETGVLKDISTFIDAYNNLKIFYEKMTEKVSDNEYASTATLHDAPEIRQIRYLLDSVFDNNINGGGKYRTLSDIGLGLVSADKSDEAPAGTKILHVVDQTALSDALNNHYDDFSKLFRGDLDITTSGARGSKLALSYMSEPLESQFYNRPMNISIQPGAAPGEVTGQVSVSIPGITDAGGPDVPGTYTRHAGDTYGYIDFNGTKLQGLRLQWDAVNLTVGAPEVFTVNLSQGISDVTYFRSNDLISSDGLTGTLRFSSEQMQRKVKDLSSEQAKLESNLEKELEKIEREFDQIDQMSILNDIFLDAISDIINPSN